MALFVFVTANSLISASSNTSKYYQTEELSSRLLIQGTKKLNFTLHANISLIAPWQKVKNIIANIVGSGALKKYKLVNKKYQLYMYKKANQSTNLYCLYETILHPKLKKVLLDACFSAQKNNFKKNLKQTMKIVADAIKNVADYSIFNSFIDVSQYLLLEKKSTMLSPLLFVTDEKNNHLFLLDSTGLIENELFSEYVSSLRTSLTAQKIFYRGVIDKLTKKNKFTWLENLFTSLATCLLFKKNNKRINFCSVIAANRRIILVSKFNNKFINQVAYAKYVLTMLSKWKIKAIAKKN